ncbi:hypothetical protein [Streptomyces sp. NPDC004629]|uniref:hypothetical protein n=1 Tax=Streptomyces sp. NPDC004629 TaxID=3364705 RepID=UPI003695D116
MTRTPGDISRRRNIADAASGFLSRATVVLYGCPEPGQDERDVMTRLRRYADARDWVVIGEVTDLSPATIPFQERRGWPAARNAVTSGQAKGIVATACPQTPVASDLEDWLRDNQAFLSEVATAPSTAEGVAQ